MIKLLRIATVYLCLAASGAQAASPQMHRVRVGVPDDTGWITADSTLGGSSVRVPMPFNDFTVTEMDPSSPARRIDVVGCKSAEGIKFSASKISYKSTGAAPEQFERLKSGGGLPNSKVTLRTVHGFPAVDIVFGDASARASERAVLIGEDLYVLVVEWPIEQGSLAEPLVPIFLESLRIPKDRPDGGTRQKPTME